MLYISLYLTSLNKHNILNTEYDLIVLNYITKQGFYISRHISFWHEGLELFHLSHLDKYNVRSIVTDIPLTERQTLGVDHLSTCQGFFSPALGSHR